MDTARWVAHALRDSIGRVAADPERCARSPGRDFTRERSLPLRSLLTLLVCWAQEAMAVELADAFGWDGSAPSPSALSQQWAKLNDEAMPSLLEEFLSRFAPAPYLGKWRLMALDGTEVQLLPGTGGERCRVRNGKGGGHHQELHCTVAYDLERRTVEGMEWQGGAEEDEPAAACELAGRSSPPPGLRDLWLADRGFCTWNVACRMLDSGASFCLRAKDSWAEALLGAPLPDAPIDAALERCLVRTRSAAARSRPAEPWLYRHFGAGRRLDCLPEGSREERWVALRLVRAELPGGADGGGGWINLVTDLPEADFPPEGLLALYGRRWEEEVAFRHLKHVVGCLVPRTRDLARAVQEVWGRLVLFDACSLAASRLPEPPRGRLHARATDLTFAFKAFMRMLRGALVSMERAAARRTHEVRRGRGHPRRARPKSPPRAGYRH